MLKYKRCISQVQVSRASAAGGLRRNCESQLCPVVQRHDTGATVPALSHGEIVNLLVHRDSFIPST